MESLLGLYVLARRLLAQHVLADVTHPASVSATMPTHRMIASLIPSTLG